MSAQSVADMQGRRSVESGGPILRRDVRLDQRRHGEREVARRERMLHQRSSAAFRLRERTAASASVARRIVRAGEASERVRISLVLREFGSMRSSRRFFAGTMRMTAAGSRVRSRRRCMVVMRAAARQRVPEHGDDGQQDESAAKHDGSSESGATAEILRPRSRFVQRRIGQEGVPEEDIFRTCTPRAAAGKRFLVS